MLHTEAGLFGWLPWDCTRQLCWQKAYNKYIASHCGKKADVLDQSNELAWLEKVKRMFWLEVTISWQVGDDSEPGTRRRIRCIKRIAIGILSEEYQIDSGRIVPDDTFESFKLESEEVRRGVWKYRGILEIA